MHIIESSMSRQFFWHLAKSNWTYGSWDIKCWGNYREEAVAVAGVVEALYIFLGYWYYGNIRQTTLIATGC